MSTNITSSEHSSTDQATRHVQGVLSRLRQLAATECSFEKLCQTAIDQLAILTAARHVIYWDVEGKEKFKATICDQRTGVFQSEQFVGLVGHAFNSRRSLAIAPEGIIQDANDSLVNPTTDSQLFVPVFDSTEKCFGIIQVTHARRLGGDEAQGYSRFVTQFERVFQAWIANSSRRNSERKTTQLRQYLEAISAIHRCEIPAIPYVVVNETRRLFEADRVTLVHGHGSRAKVLAISGTAQVDARSNMVKGLRELGARAFQYRERLIVNRATDSMPMQIQDLIHQHFEASHCRCLVALPVRFTSLAEANENGQAAESPGKSVDEYPTTLLIEFFEREVNQDEIEDHCDWITDQTSIAVQKWRSSSVIANVPLIRSLGLAGSRLGSLRKWIAAGSLLVAIGFVAAMILIPAGMWIKCEGIVQPKISRNVFAPAGGTITKVYVEYGQNVEVNQPLFDLFNEELSMQIVALEGELAETREKIRSQSSALVRGQTKEGNSYADSANLDVLLIKENSLLQKHEMLVRQEKETRVFSTVQGTIVTWDAARRLQGLPVNRGNGVLVIAAQDQGWQIDLRIRQNQLGYVDRALNKSQAAPRVLIRSSLDPNVTFEASLTQVAERAELDELGEVAFHGLANLENHVGELNNSQLRSGTKVTARIYCGNHALGYVWFHDVVDYLKTNWFF